MQKRTIGLLAFLMTGAPLFSMLPGDHTGRVLGESPESNGIAPAPGARPIPEEVSLVSEPREEIRSDRITRSVEESEANDDELVILSEQEYPIPENRGEEENRPAPEPQPTVSEPDDGPTTTFGSPVQPPMPQPELGDSDAPTTPPAVSTPNSDVTNVLANPETWNSVMSHMPESFVQDLADALRSALLNTPAAALKLSNSPEAIWASMTANIDQDVLDKITQPVKSTLISIIEKSHAIADDLKKYASDLASDKATAFDLGIKVMERTCGSAQTFESSKALFKRVEQAHKNVVNFCQSLPDTVMLLFKMSLSQPTEAIFLEPKQSFFSCKSTAFYSGLRVSYALGEQFSDAQMDSVRSILNFMDQHYARKVCPEAAGAAKLSSIHERADLMKRVIDGCVDGMGDLFAFGGVRSDVSQNNFKEAWRIASSDPDMLADFLCGNSRSTFESTFELFHELATPLQGLGDLYGDIVDVLPQLVHDLKGPEAAKSIMAAPAPSISLGESLLRLS